MSNALVPELSVSNSQTSLAFYCGVLGFAVRYDRPEEGFAFLELGEAELMIDEIGKGRDFDQGHLPKDHPFGKGINLQIKVGNLGVLLKSLADNNIQLFLPAEDRWYRIGAQEVGNRQFVVADPDGYLLRFYQDLGHRPI